MRLTNQKPSIIPGGTLAVIAGVFVTGSLAAFAVEHYSVDEMIPTFYASSTSQCTMTAPNGQPFGCPPINMSGLGFSSLRSM